MNRNPRALVLLLLSVPLTGLGQSDVSDASALLQRKT